MKSGGLEEKTWVWLIGNTDAPDADVLAAARSWIDPVPATVLSGGTGGSYDPAQCAYVIDLAGSPQAMITFGGTGTGRIFNPVFVLNNPPAGEVHIGVNGAPPNTVQAGTESRYFESSLVVWIGESIPDNSKVTILIK